MRLRRRPGPGWYASGTWAPDEGTFVAGRRIRGPVQVVRATSSSGSAVRTRQLAARALRRRAETDGAAWSAVRRRGRYRGRRAAGRHSRSRLPRNRRRPRRGSAPRGSPRRQPLRPARLRRSSPRRRARPRTQGRGLRPATTGTRRRRRTTVVPRGLLRSAGAAGKLSCSTDAERRYSRGRVRRFGVGELDAVRDGGFGPEPRSGRPSPVTVQQRRSFPRAPASGSSVNIRASENGSIVARGRYGRTAAILRRTPAAPTRSWAAG